MDRIYGSIEAIQVAVWQNSCMSRQTCYMGRSKNLYQQRYRNPAHGILSRRYMAIFVIWKKGAMKLVYRRGICPGNSVIWRTCRMNHKPESRGFKNALAKFYFVRRWSNWPACALTCCLNVGCLAQTSCSAKSGLTASRRDVSERPTVEIRACSLVLYYRFQNGSGIASWDRRQRKCHRSVHYPTKVPAGIQSDNNQTVRQLKWSPEDTYVATKELTYTVQIKIRLLNETGMTLTYVYWRWSERPTIERIPLPLRTAGDVETQRCS
jgi:hypothetical protein